MVVLIVLLVLGIGGAASADDYEPVNPSFPDPHYLDPQLKVTPSDALADGQTVMVTGQYFGMNDTNGVLRECTVDLSLCGPQSGSFTTGANGEFNPLDAPVHPDDPRTVPVSFVAKASFVAGNGTTIDCHVKACAVYARWSNAFEVRAGSHHVNFLAPGSGRYTPLTPARILDTRDGTGGRSGPIGAGTSIDVQVTGRGGVPSTGVSSVVVNVTVTQPSAAGFLTLYPAGSALPLASSLDFTPGQTVPNLVVVKLGTGGRVATFNSAGGTHVIFDVAGWYSDSPAGDSGRYRPLVPARILDTRDGTGGGTRLGPGASLDLQVTGRGGVPASGAEAAVLDVVATSTTATSFLTAYPTGAARPLASNLNFDAGQTVSNRAMVKLGTGGRVTIFNLAGATDVIVDVSGWYTDASAPAALGTFVPLVPARVLDTRDGTGGVAGPRPAGTGVDVQVTGRGQVPESGVSAVVLNVTVTQPAGPGFVTIFPAGGSLPVASDLTFGAGETRPNLAVVRVGSGGKVTLYVSTQTHVVFDVAGWFS
jgi:hypothetical protein